MMMDMRSYWDAILRQDADEIRAYFHPDADIRWHNTNEHFNVDEFIQVNCEYPGDWAGNVERIEMLGDLVVTATNVRVADGSLSFHVVSFMKMRDGKIASIDEYWGDDGLPPQWRLDKKIGRAIL